MALAELAARRYLERSIQDMILHNAFRLEKRKTKEKQKTKKIRNGRKGGKKVYLSPFGLVVSFKFSG